MRVFCATMRDKPGIDATSLNLFLRYRYTPSPHTILKGGRILRCRHTDNAFLQINHDQGSGGVEFRKRHLFSFQLGGGFRRS